MTACSVHGCGERAGPLPGPTSGRDLCPEHRDDERHELERRLEARLLYSRGRIKQLEKDLEAAKAYHIALRAEGAA